MRSKFKIGLVCVLAVLVMWLVAHLYRELVTYYENSGSLTSLEYSWFFRLLLNLCGYGLILAPPYLLYKYLNRTNYFDNISNSSYLSRTLLLCYGPPSLSEAPVPRTPRGDAVELAGCFTGLMAAYLVWGLLQEKIMTQAYSLADGSTVRFTDSQLLVFINRCAALIAAVGRQWAQGRPLVVPPLHSFSYCALSNVVSAWCQYEALRYVSFPTQVLSKSCKVLPVMLMGKIISKNTYEFYEYVTAALISLGMILFMLGSGAHTWQNAHEWAVSGAGLILLATYMASDAFTSSWQQALFAKTAASPLQMLCAVNVFSAALTAPALLAGTGRRVDLFQNPIFVTDVAVLSASSALGQLLLYRTIAKFGAVVFTIIMTLRQAVSILLSCVVYGHSITASGVAGVTLVFAAVLLRLYCAHRTKVRARPPL